MKLAEILSIMSSHGVKRKQGQQPISSVGPWDPKTRKVTETMGWIKLFL